MIGRLAAFLRIALLVMPLVVAAPAGAVLPQEQLADPALEARARAISRELRCQVCQNQSIDDSNAPLAADLRRLVRERLLAGDSDDEIIRYLTARYGDYVLLRPPVRRDTMVLWYGPAIVLALGAAGLIAWFRRRRATPDSAPLTPDEERRLERLLDDRRPTP
ncbi:MAG TPA: cytochrome c-type biogenesis protein [Alphaproteobacteria bacterium]